MSAALIDTSAILGPRDALRLALADVEDVAISSITLAELEAGVVATSDWEERFRRQQTFEWVKRTFRVIPVDEAVAAEFGKLCLLVSRIGRSSRGRRSLDLLIAATAVAHDLPLVTANGEDLKGAEFYLRVIPLGA